MLSYKADIFLDNVLSYVHYSFDRKKIRLELESHIAEKIKYYLNSGSTEEEAENSAINDMGDAGDLGKELNRLHKPVLGWIIKNSKAFGVLLLIIICSLILFNAGVKRERSLEISRNTNAYISSMYWELNSTTHLLKYVEDWGDSVKNTDLTVNPFSQLLLRLNTMKILSRSAISYIGYTEDLNCLSNVADSFDIIYSSIGGGVSYNNQLLCYDFLKDGTLSENEIKFLTSLRDDLEIIEQSLYDSEKNEHSLDISLQEFEKITRPFVNKYRAFNLTGMGLSN